MPNRCLFGWPNYVDTQLDPSTTGLTTLRTPTFTGGGWNASFPRTNLATRYLYQTARSTDATAANTKVIVDMIIARPILCCGIVRHNLGQTATIQIKGGTTSGASDVYDSTALAVWPADYYEPGNMPYGYADPTTGKPTKDLTAHYKSLAFVHTFPAIKSARFWEIDIVDTTNGNGFVELGRLWLSPGYVPDISLAPGYELGWASPTEFDESRGGVRFFNPRGQRREVAGMIQNAPVSQALAFIHEMYGRVGLDGQLLYAFNPDDTYHLHRRSFLANLKVLNPIVHPYFGRQTAAFALSEEL